MPLPIASASPPPADGTKLPVVSTGTFVDDLFSLPGLRDLPFQSTLKTCIELALLITLFLLLRYAIGRAVRSTTERMAKHGDEVGNFGRASRVRTLGQLTNSLTLYMLAFIFLVSALTVIGFPIASLIASAGIAGVAVGFGAQKLVKDVFTGFFILLEDQYSVGEYVTINTVTGRVEEFALRTTRIRDDDGKLYILSNGDIAQVCNQSRGPLAGSFEIAIASTGDLAKATEVLNEALKKKSDELELAAPATIRGVSAIEAAKTTLAVQFRAGHGTRPAGIAYQLREVALDALIAAQIPLG